jgi:hypothetical protein
MTDNPYETPPDKEEMERVINAMLEAWKSGSDYIAESSDMYFRYAVPVMDINGAVRIPPGKRMRTSDGREFMMDSYRAPGGKVIRMGYEITNDPDYQTP